MSLLSANSSHDQDDGTESNELIDLIASWDKSPRPLDSGDKPKVIQIEFSEDLANYIRTGVDPNGRYAKPPTRKEKLGIALGYAFIILMMLVGLLGGGVGRKLFEELVRFIQGR